MKTKPRILTLTRLARIKSVCFPVNAFTLLELVISIAITFTVLLTAATIAVSEVRSSIKLYVYQSLRDQMARVTFLIESEVGEASSFVSTEPQACAAQRDATTDTFLFGINHTYAQGPNFITTFKAAPATSTICYFNRMVNTDTANPVFDLYRFGPPFDSATGVLSPNAASLTLISPGTRLINSARNTGVDINNSTATTCTDCDGHTLTYSVSLQHDTTANTANPRVWNLSYTPVDAAGVPIVISARILSFCISSDTNTGWCNDQ